MKSNDIFNIIKNITKVLNNITLKTDDRGNYVFGFSGSSNFKKNMENKSNKDDESNSIEYNESVKLDYNDDEMDDYNERQDISLDSQGGIDSITNELTSSKLQQAIILSEIVGKPRSKTRRKRRF